MGRCHPFTQSISINDLLYLAQVVHSNGNARHNSLRPGPQFWKCTTHTVTRCIWDLQVPYNCIPSRRRWYGWTVQPFTTIYSFYVLTLTLSQIGRSIFHLHCMLIAQPYMLKQEFPHIISCLVESHIQLCSNRPVALNQPPISSIFVTSWLNCKI